MTTDTAAILSSGADILLAATHLLEEMSFYEPPDRPWHIRVRGYESLRVRVAKALTLLQTYAQSRGDDPRQIDVSYAVRRSLAAWADQVFAAFGGEPKDDEELEQQLEAIREGVRQAKLKKR